MKRLFTLAILTMIASITFAQSPTMTKKAASKKIEKVLNANVMNQKMKDAQVLEFKANAAQNTSSSVLRRAAKAPSAKYQQVGQLKASKVMNVTRKMPAAEKPKAVKKSVAKADNGDEVEVETDENGIIVGVTGGETRTYARNTTDAIYSYVSGGQIAFAYQGGAVEIVVAGNDYYIKDILKGAELDTYVKGTLSADGQSLVVAPGQKIYSGQSGEVAVYMGDYVDGTFVQNDNDIVYSVDGDVLTLQGANFSLDSEGYITFEEGVLGGFWTDDYSFAGMGDFGTILTYDPTYVAPEAVLVELPEGAVVEDWYLNGTDSNNGTDTPIKNRAVKVSFVDGDVYVYGIFKNMPYAWVKGTVDGNNITFPKFQYLGSYEGTYDIWFIGRPAAESAITDATATYDADTKTITIVENVLANAATDRVYYLEWVKNAVITADKTEAVEPIITELTAELPYSNTFDSDAEMAEVAFYDANEDGCTFKFTADAANGTTAIACLYNSANYGDDYAVFPGLALEAGKSYKVSVDARAYSAAFPERVEVVAGTVAKASELTSVVIEPTDLASSEYRTLTADFIPEADGVYYFAIHSVSDPDELYLYADNFKVKENDPNAPQAPEFGEVKAADQCALTAYVDVVAPTSTLGGAAIDGDVDLTLTCGEFTETKSVQPGQTASFAVDVTESDLYTFTAEAAIGELKSEAISTQLYVGEDTPANPANFDVAQKDPTTMALTWDAVTEGATGGQILPENITYNVYPVEMVEFWGMLFPTIDTENPYSVGQTETAYDIEDFPADEGAQAYTYFAVAAVNSAGESSGVMDAVLTGAPYEMPVVETVPNGQLAYWWGITMDSENYNGDGGGAISDDDEFVMTSVTEGWLEINSGKINIASANNPTISFDAMGYGELSVKVYGMNKSVVENLGTLSSEYNNYKINVNAEDFAGEPWVRFDVHVEFDGAAEAYLKNIMLVDLLQDNLKVAVSAPKAVTAGQNAEVKVTVKNEGEQATKDYEVVVYADDEEIAKFAGEDVAELAFMESTEYVATLATSVFDEPKDVVVRAEAVFAADEKPADNADETVVVVNAPTANPVDAVVATETSEGVAVLWTVKSGSVPTEIVEDFESYEHDVVYADGESCGPWKAVDVSKGKAYGWNSSAINWSHMGETFAFGTIDFVEGGLEGLEAVSGTKSALFLSEVSAATEQGQVADKYMISPELPGCAQVVKFQAMAITDQYGAEEFEILYSTTDNNVESFQVAESFATTETTWTEFSAALPAGTKYFAIHYISNDIFGLYVDDLTYTGEANSQPTAFNIYIDETQVATVGGEERIYTYKGALAEGTHTASVTAVYGEAESLPVSAEVSVTTGISNIEDAQKAEIYTVDGIRVSNVKNLKAGVYVVNGKKMVIK